MIAIKVFGKIIKWALPWESILGFILEIASNLLKEWLRDQNFTKKAKYFTIGVYAFAEGYGEELAKDTRTSLDDETIQDLIESCEAASIAHNFKLPEIEEIP